MRSNGASSRNSLRFAVRKTRPCAKISSNAQKNSSNKGRKKTSGRSPDHSSPGTTMPNETVKLIECPRDAWQGLKRLIPTEVKAQYLRALIEAGFKHIDAVSFVSPRAVPQMADSEKVLQAMEEIAKLEIRSISLADTVGLATPNLIGRVVRSVMADYGRYDIGVYMHSTHSDASTKVLAAYDAGCRRIDSAIGGLGGCPFVQDALVGNIATESVIAALQKRGVALPVGKGLESVLAINADISAKYESEDT